MSNDERAAIVKLLREHVRAVADNDALRSILVLEHRERRVAEIGSGIFEAIRLSENYAARIAASEPGIAQINAALAEDVQREDNDLIQLTERLPRHHA